MERDSTKPPVQGRSEQHSQHRSSRPQPGKASLTSRIGPSTSSPVQARMEAGAAAGRPRSATMPEISSVQMKSLAQWTQSVWMKAAHGYPPVGAAVQARSVAASGGGTSMPRAVQAKMENAFGVDFSSVRIHEGPQASAIGAAAYTQGTDLHFAPGQYNPTSQSGQELLGHELTHVVQQSQGRVPAAVQGKDAVAINSDPGLEREADILGARAARGERVFGGQGSAAASAGAIQRKEQGEQAGGEQSGGLRELTPEELDQLYPPDQFIPVSLSAFTSQVVQPAYTAKRPLGRGPIMFGALYHEHIFFEDGGDPPNIGHMGSGGLGQDTADGYTRLLQGLDDARMRQAVANVGNPGAYSLLRNNCQHYVARVVAEYRRLEALEQNGQ